MIVAMPVKTNDSDGPLAPLFGNAKYFAVAKEGEKALIEPMDQTGGRDVARTLIANDVDVLITSHLGLNPYTLLKSYGIKVYFAGEERITVSEALKQLYAGTLVEVTADNYNALLGEEETRHAHTGSCGSHTHAKHHHSHL